MEIDLVFVVRLLVATGLGAVIGLQRELSGKPAGLRTNLLICLGAALITHVSLAITARLGVGDPARIAAQIVAGIGFLGAGTILRSQYAVHGLTSAATIWVVAAVGLTVGAGFERQAAFATVIVVLALGTLGQVERRFLGPNTLTASILVSDRTIDIEALAPPARCAPPAQLRLAAPRRRQRPRAGDVARRARRRGRAGADRCGDSGDHPRDLGVGGVRNVVRGSWFESGARWRRAPDPRVAVPDGHP